MGQMDWVYDMGSSPICDLQWAWSGPAFRQGRRDKGPASPPYRGSLLLCYVDVDGVLCDAVRAALNVWGFTGKYPPGESNFAKVCGINEGTFWTPFNYDFWRQLDKTPEADQIMGVIESAGFTKISLISTQRITLGSLEGKREWVKRNFPKYLDSFILVPNGWRPWLAGPNTILVDDSENNVDEFIMLDGQGVLIPRPWNSLHAVNLEDWLRRDFLTLLNRGISGREKANQPA